MILFQLKKKLNNAEEKNSKKTNGNYWVKGLKIIFFSFFILFCFPSFLQCAYNLLVLRTKQKKMHFKSAQI